MATIEAFHALDIRIGRIIEVLPFPEAKKPAWKLVIDFGPLGIRKSSAQITRLYSAEDLTGKQVAAVVNFPPRQIGPFVSEVLVLGCVREDGAVVLLQPDREVEPGIKVS